MAVAHRIYAEALFEAAKESGRLAQVHEALADFAAAIEQTPELALGAAQPAARAAREGAASSPTSRATTSRCSRTSSASWRRRAAPARSRRSRAEFERLIAREERRLTVELTTARELTDDEANAIVAQIEKAAGRKVEATRQVDPDLVGGIVLQAGSYRVDASVRGRLERLRQELVRS